MGELQDFEKRKREMIAALGDDRELRELSRRWYEDASKKRYSYHFTWLGVPIIQFPQDIVAIQEIVWRVKPDVIIETGIAHGGSLILHASLLSALNSDGIVVGIDIDIRAHNRAVIENHPLAKRITLIEASSTSRQAIDEVAAITAMKPNALVILDSNHTAEHVLAELQGYEKFVGKGSYLIVLDTVIDDMPAEFSANRPWGPGRGPKAAVAEFIRANDRFVVDQEYDNKLVITAAPGGFLRCIK